MSMIRAIAKQPGHPPYEIHLSNDLRSLQTFVGGYIETVTVASDLVVICNEEGRLWELPESCSIAGVDFCGPVLLVGKKDDEFCDVPLLSAERPWSMWIQEAQHQHNDRTGDGGQLPPGGQQGEADQNSGGAGRVLRAGNRGDAPAQRRDRPQSDHRGAQQ